MEELTLLLSNQVIWVNIIQRPDQHFNWLIFSCLATSLAGLAYVQIYDLEVFNIRVPFASHYLNQRSKVLFGGPDENEAFADELARFERQLLKVCHVLMFISPVNVDKDSLNILHVSEQRKLR